MTLLELVHTRPDWFGALEVAISRPAAGSFPGGRRYTSASSAHSSTAAPA